MIIAIIITVILIVIVLYFKYCIRYEDGDLLIFTILGTVLVVLIWVAVLTNKYKKPNPPQVEEIAQQVEETTKGGYEIIDYVSPDNKWNNHFILIRNESEMYKASKWWKDNGFSFNENCYRIIEYPLYAGVIDGKLEYVNDDRLKSLNNVKLIKLK